ncbi:MAG: archease [Candidatus Diapherotrites archaeon]|nr:archease [Candidatus Diapherotrites archaeon]
MFELFEHEADIGIRGFGRSMEEAFRNAAKAMFSVMVDLEDVQTVEQRTIKVSAADAEALLVEFLNSLLSIASMENMLFSEFKVKIEKNSEYVLECVAKGEKINLKRHRPKIEVKAATYSQLAVSKRNNRWVAQCIVDV